VRLRETADGLVVDRYVDIPLPPEAFVNGEVADRATVIKALQEASKSLGTSLVSASLSESKSYLFETTVAGKSKEAAFLETHRYAAVSGATMELTKLEGVTLNKEDKVGYFAISRIEAPMSIHTTTTSGVTTTNAVNGTTSDILLTASRPGAVYASHLAGNINDTSGTAINSSWVPTDFYVPDGLYGEALSSADNDGNLANVNKISQPDNVKFSEAMRTLFISEDGTGHLNNYMWAYNVDTNVLSKVLATPAGAESTGLQAVDNLNGFAYIMTGFQHAGGELSYNSGTGTGTSNGKTVPADVMSAIISNWGGINKKSPVGYIAGLPTLGS
jgi:hypothetical protein